MYVCMCMHVYIMVSSSKIKPTHKECCNSILKATKMVNIYTVKIYKLPNISLYDISAISNHRRHHEGPPLCYRIPPTDSLNSQTLILGQYCCSIHHLHRLSPLCLS